MTDHDTAAVLTEADLDRIAIDVHRFSDTSLARRARTSPLWHPRYALSVREKEVAQAAARLAAQRPHRDDRDTRAWLCIKCGYGSQEHGMSGHPSFLCVADMALVQVVPAAQPPQDDPQPDEREALTERVRPSETVRSVGPVEPVVAAARDAIAKRLTWPSMHWGVESVHRDAWPHIAAAACAGVADYLAALAEPTPGTNP